MARDDCDGGDDPGTPTPPPSKPSKPAPPSKPHLRCRWCLQPASRTTCGPCSRQLQPVLLKPNGKARESRRAALAEFPGLAGRLTVMGDGKV